jgi:phosphatidate phosphatase APP1
MIDWQKIIAPYLNNIEEHFDRIKFLLHERLGDQDPMMVLPYRGYGNSNKIYLKGRVLENKGITTARSIDNLWDNLLNIYRRFDSDEIPFAHVLAHFAGNTQVVKTDSEGYFDLRIELNQKLSSDTIWYPIQLKLIKPHPDGIPRVRSVGEVLIPPPTARFGVISDIDDTVAITDTQHLLKMMRNVFLGNARTHLPFIGVAAYFQSLHTGWQGKELNPIFYVSSSPWNLYDLITDFLNLHTFPTGPILLRDWGITETEILPLQNREHKLTLIRQVIRMYPNLPFILIGDSGQEDPEIYSEVASQFPGHILAIYIRDVSLNETRSTTITNLANKMKSTGCDLILTKSTSFMAAHATQHGWISANSLDEIRTQVRLVNVNPG